MRGRASGGPNPNPTHLDGHAKALVQRDGSAAQYCLPETVNQTCAKAQTSV